jgi:hypothetical protein
MYVLTIVQIPITKQILQTNNNSLQHPTRFSTLNTHTRKSNIKTNNKTNRWPYITAPDEWHSDEINNQDEEPAGRKDKDDYSYKIYKYT